MRWSPIVALAACEGSNLGTNTPQGPVPPNVPCGYDLLEWCPECAALPTIDEILAEMIDPSTGEQIALWKRCIDPTATDAWQTVVSPDRIETRFYFDSSGALTATREWSPEMQCTNATGDGGYVLIYGTQPACAIWCEVSDLRNMATDLPCGPE